MKTPLVPALLALVGIALVPSAPASQVRPPSVQPLPPNVPLEPIPHGPFYIRSYTGKCMTFGGPLQPVPGDNFPSTVWVSMSDCTQSSGPFPFQEQRVIAEEINGRHEVILRVLGKVIGASGNLVAEGVPLELQDYKGAAGQIWAFDGDSLILVADRDLVAELKGGRTPEGTPVVLGRRDLDDSEFWTFVAVDGTATKPTNGFVQVNDVEDLAREVAEATWGSVIEVSQTTIDLDGLNLPLTIPAGVTIRGDRRGTRRGALLHVNSYRPVGAVLAVDGDYVRVTGLRLRGPSRSKDDSNPVVVAGIFVDDDDHVGTIIDNNDMSDWTQAAVQVKLYDDYDHGDRDRPGDDETCGDGTVNRARTVRVVRNFMHHNVRDGYGYGVTLYANGFATILGNTFLYNRHAIAADGIRLTGYQAWHNLVLSAAPSYGLTGAEHDFDMHGSDGSSHHTGGIAGSDVDIAFNTFLGTNRYNYDLRGIPCAPHQFRGNVVRQGEGAAVRWYEIVDGVPMQPDTDWREPPPWMAIAGNRFNSQDPTRHLRVGDFDGDGVQDLFLATGTAWYYSPGGQAEWRYLNFRTTETDKLLFGDFDGDRRTDVLSRHGREWSVAWAGRSTREKINVHDGDIGDFSVGDFNGDRRADLFHADGQQWSVSYGGVGPFTPYEFTYHRVQNLRFGDFNNDGRTDAFAVINGYWMVRYGGIGGWQLLRPALPTPFARLVVADFNGNGRADVATSSSFPLLEWKVCYDGTGSDWATLRAGTVPLDTVAAIGSFNLVAGADVLDWNRYLDSPGDYLSFDRNLDIFSSGSAPPQRLSRNHMR